MKRRSLMTGLATIALPNFALAQGRADVIATFSVLADMASVIAGNDLAVLALVPVDADVHVWQARPEDLRRLNAASALVENGLNLEGWTARLAQAAEFRGRRIVASAGVTPRSFSEGGRRVTDPHAWQDPRNGILYAHAITDGLATTFPNEADRLRARGAAYAAEIADTDRWIEQTLAPIPPEKRRILTSHDAFGYYGARYGIELRAVQGISTEAEPSARDIATLVAQIRREKIRAVFVETMTSPRLAEIVAKESGAVLGQAVYSDALSAKNGPAGSYIAMLRHNTALFAAAMAKE